jgi:ABC-2 type transport system ATP-binding protein
MITVRNVYKHFKDVKAVDGVSLEVHPGEFVALLGPNGAGKTTLVEMIEGLREPDSGEISILGKNWKTGEKYLRGILGISLQETNFIDKLTALETLNLFASFYGLGRERNREILELVGLKEKRHSYTMNLSHGQKQKLALGIALINGPRILILDEPTTGLDPNARRELWEILKSLKRGGTSLILTTHYMDEAEYLCDRIIIMNKGRILVEGTLRELLAMHGGKEIVSFELGTEGGGPLSRPEGTPGALPDGAEPLFRVSGMPDLLWDDEGRSARLFVDDVATALPALFRAAERGGLSFARLEWRKMNLDDLFVSLTGRRLDE